MMGIVETKKKKGTVSTSPDIFTLLNKSLNPYILDGKTLKDIFELRLVLEIGMADLLFARIKKVDINQLREIVQKDPVDSQYHYSDIDFEIKFHSKLYQITKNETLIKFQKLLLPIFNYVHQSGLLIKLDKEKVYVTHASLVDILENGTPEKFRNAMRMHLENHFERVLAPLKNNS
jgi:GntR family transcriptional regulator, transcriptional repressor for pyruvate dehydrogenase complex